MSDKKKINLGFDIGVASVGWSIIDEDYNIIDMGVRLFDDPASPKNEKLENQERRENRDLRRQIRRSRKRKDDLIYVFIKNDFVKDEEEFYKIINQPLYVINDEIKNILDLKVKGLSEKLSKEELLTVLFSYLSNRGYFYETVEEEEKENNDPNQKETISYNPKILPSIQLKQFSEQYGWYKSAPYRKDIPNKAYVDEIKKLFETQSLSIEFQNDYFKIFTRMRDYKTGPGSKKSPTPWGLWRIEDGKLVNKGNNLWDLTVGHCTIYPEELRGARNAPVSEVFNFLNELNNLSILENPEHPKLTENDKKSLFRTIQDHWMNKNEEKKITIASICEIIWPNEDPKIHINSIKGFRQTSYAKKKERDPSKAEFQKLENYFKTVEFLKNNGLIQPQNIDLLNLNFLKQVNDIFEQVRQNRNPSEAVEKIKNLKQEYQTISDDNIQIYIKSLKKLSDTHSLSYKAMEEYIPYGVKENINQMVYFEKQIQQGWQNRFKQNENELKMLSKYVPNGLLDDEIISPTTRRAYNQTIAVLNKILKKYNKFYDLENITIELARDKNTKQEKDNIEEGQKTNKEILESIESKIDPNLQEKFKNANYKTKKKLKLLKQQDNIDIYDGEFISFDSILANPGAYHIDHIIPLSISGDDSFNNTVVTKNDNNDDKGNRTPWQWLSSIGKWKEFKQRVKSNPNFSKNKKHVLLYEANPSRDVLGFINRNLVDTRYASKSVLNVLQDYFNFYQSQSTKTNDSLYKNVKVRVLNGAITHYARFNLFHQEKERELNYHHAIDATIMCYLGMSQSIKKQLENNYMFNKTLNEYQNKNDLYLIDESTGEIFSQTQLYAYTSSARKIEDEMNAFKNNENGKSVKYYRLLRTKKNIKLSDKTIYSFQFDKKDETKGNFIDSVDLLCQKGSEKEKLKEYFAKDSKITEEELRKLFIYNDQKNRHIFDALKIIYQENYDPESNANPFILYMNKLEPLIKNHKFVRINEFEVIRKLRMKGDKKKTNNLIILKKHNNKAVMESLKSLEVRIYKNAKNKLVLLPINQKVLTFKNNKMQIDEDKIKDILKNQLNVINQERYLTIYDGTTLIDNTTNELYYCNAGGNFNANRLEIKYLEKENNKRMQVAISSIAKKMSIIELDVLGKKYSLIDINEYFKI